MYFPLNVSKQLIKSGRLELNYNQGRFFKKYELGYWELYQDINNATRTPVNGPYKIFRPIFRTSNYTKAVRKLDKLNVKSFA